MSGIEALAEVIASAADALAPGGGVGVKLESPPRAELGDYSTNAPLALAPRLGSTPSEVAEALAGEISERLGGALERSEVAGPGFLNLYLRDGWFLDALGGILAAGERYGSRLLEPGVRVNVEFVSANPTGPLHVGHARYAAYGDSLARILEARGQEVTREFYINDYGSQVTKLGESVRALAVGEPVPEDGYRGDYVGELVPAELARTLDLDALSRVAIDACLARIRATLERFGVRFDVWFSERSLHEDGKVELALRELAERGETYQSDGALWLRTSAHGDDKDRVLVRSNGEHTYFTSDIAYLEDKRERGFERILYVWGADHHGYVGRIRAASVALGADPDCVEIVIGQFVHLIGTEGRTAMSKREGEYVTLDDLVAEIGVDAARWFLLARSHDTTVDLDLDLAVRESGENPVYYVQYAHARIVSILDRAGAERVGEALRAIVAVEPLHPSERALVKRLLAFPGELAEAAERRAPHRISAYALELAQEFTAFYRDCHVLGATPRETESLRLALSVASRDVIAAALRLLGVHAPSQM
ncbi:MAG TPA: arginine--tRNA ligase [Solirubrobacteraceae bacterium]